MKIDSLSSKLISYLLYINFLSVVMTSVIYQLLFIYG